MKKLGNPDPDATGFLTPKAPFWERPTYVLWTAAQYNPEAAEATFAANPRYMEFKNKYDKSRKTVTRTGTVVCSCSKDLITAACGGILKMCIICQKILVMGYPNA